MQKIQLPIVFKLLLVMCFCAHEIGAHVILACRDPVKGEEARRDLRHEGGQVEFRKLDLADLKSVREFAAKIRQDGIKIHILVNNAGLMMCPYTETAQGFELQIGTMHLGHFLLTNLLLPQMKHGEPARIINVSSILHLLGAINLEDFNYKKSGYDRMDGYCNSKLANVLFTRELAKKLKGSNIQVFAVYPGPVYSNIGRHVFNQFLYDYAIPLFMKTTEEGIHPIIHCALEAEQHPDMYFSDCSVGWPIAAAKDDVLAEKLWKLSENLVQLSK